MTRSRSITELLNAVRKLPATAPQSERLAKSGYATHKDHWVGWLMEYDGPGYYGRSSWDVDAQTVYQRLNCGEMIVWLNEAAGESPGAIATAIAAMARCNGNAQAKAKIARTHLPWDRLATRLFRQ